MGTSSRTTLPIILADELEADWKRVKIEQAIGDARYGEQDTDGSHSVREFFEPMRAAGATGRLMLEQAAAQQWNVPAPNAPPRLHTVVHKPSGRRAGLWRTGRRGRQAARARRKKSCSSRQPPWRYIGKGIPATTSGHLHRQGHLRHGRQARRHGLRLHRASSRAGRQGEVV